MREDTVTWIFGLLIAIIFSLSMGYNLGNKYPTQLQKCKNLYNSEELEKDPQIQEALNQSGVESFEKLLELRCTSWIKNGQKF